MGGQPVSLADRLTTDRLGYLVAIAAGIWAATAAALLSQPLGPSTMDPDGFASVLYFERILAGRHLESFIPTTPKPLLTLVYGLGWAAVGDWRLPIIVAVVGWGIAVGLLTLLAWRSGGALAAGFVGVALGGWSLLALEVSRANSLVWALAFLAGAALLLRDARPRPATVGLVGLLLLLAGTSRIEGLLATAALGGVLALVWLASRLGLTGAGQRGSRRATRALRWWPSVVLGAAALPVMLLHDWLLTGDPWFWTTVPARYTAIYAADLAPQSFAAYLSTVVERLSPLGLLALLALAGLVWLVGRRDWVVLGGLLVLSIGVLAGLAALAMRGIYISNRYYEPVELAIVAGAGIGLGGLASWLTAAIGRRPPWLRVPPASAAWSGVILAVGLGAAAALLLRWPVVPWDARAERVVADVRQSSANLAGFGDRFASVLAAAPERPDDTWSVVGAPERDQRASVLLVPSRSVSRVAVEQQASLLDVGDLYAALLEAGTPGRLLPGPTVLHDASVDRPREQFEFLEVSQSSPVGAIVVSPLEAYPSLGVWLHQLLDAR